MKAEKINNLTKEKYEELEILATLRDLADEAEGACATCRSGGWNCDSCQHGRGC